MKFNVHKRTKTTRNTTTRSKIGQPDNVRSEYLSKKVTPIGGQNKHQSLVLHVLGQKKGKKKIYDKLLYKHNILKN